MCKRYKVRLQIDIPVGIFQLSRAIELEIDIDRLRSLKLPARPIGLALRSLRSFRVAAAPWRSLRSLSGRLRLPARRLRLLALRSAALHSASPSAPWHGLRPKVWGLTPQLPDYVAVSPQRRPRSAHRTTAYTWLYAYNSAWTRRIRFPVDLDTDIWSLTSITCRELQNRK